MSDEWRTFIRQIIPTSAPMFDVFATREASVPGYYCQQIAALALVDMWPGDEDADEDSIDEEDERRPPRGVNPLRRVEAVRFVDGETFYANRPSNVSLWLGLYWEAQLAEPETQRHLTELANQARRDLEAEEAESA